MSKRKISSPKSKNVLIEKNISKIISRMANDNMKIGTIYSKKGKIFQKNSTIGAISERYAQENDLLCSLARYRWAAEEGVQIANKYKPRNTTVFLRAKMKTKTGKLYEKTFKLDDIQGSTTDGGTLRHIKARTSLNISFKDEKKRNRDIEIAIDHSPVSGYEIDVPVNSSDSPRTVERRRKRAYEQKMKNPKPTGDVGAFKMRASDSFESIDIVILESPDRERKRMKEIQKAIENFYKRTMKTSKRSRR